MTEELQKVLEMLADKYGTTVSELIAEMARKNVAVDAVVLVLTMVVGGGVIFFLVQEVRENGEGRVLLVLICILVAVIFGYSLSDLIGWLIAPNISALERIMQMLMMKGT